MTIDKKNLIGSILDSISRIDYIKPEEIPDIALYMDQVTTFMDAHLESSKRYEDDKILTKTMINNYTKNHLLPPSDKKKYSSEHILLLIFIYYFKGFLSINDIQTLLQPLTDKYFSIQEGFSLTDIYNEAFSMEKEQIEILKNDIQKKYEKSSMTFQNAPPKDRDFLQLFSFICLLSFDVYLKKQIIENLIDLLPSPTKSKK
ncbi:MAG: DUF1836 domain-containing protein [Ruminococcus sp.]|jgi:hypothetical protein